MFWPIITVSLTSWVLKKLVPRLKELGLDLFGSFREQAGQCLDGIELLLDVLGDTRVLGLDLLHVVGYLLNHSLPLLVGVVLKGFGLSDQCIGLKIIIVLL